ncbi:MAG: hypothetical protein H5T74_04385 [Actinobacteria bacterium]|nr:hypothetical protein [Actinomycetota bacterium]
MRQDRGASVVKVLGKYPKREREGTGRPGFRTAVFLVYALLSLLVAASFILYISRLSGVPGADQGGTSREDAFSREKEVLAAPENVRVTIKKGATISWDAKDDIRILGYNVYRYKAGDDRGDRVNPAIISDNVYYDDEGTMFNTYAVAAVDTSGREGKISVPVTGEVEPVSLTGLTPTREPEVVEDTTIKTPPEKSLPPTLVSCVAEGMTYQGVWYREHYAEVTGSVIMTTPYGGDSCTYTFTGEQVAVISTRHWNYGIMQVYIDGELRAEVDLYSPQVKVSDTVFSASNLGPGAHTIKLVCSGRKNADANFTFINLEALQVR